MNEALINAKIAEWERKHAIAFNQLEGLKEDLQSQLSLLQGVSNGRFYFLTFFDAISKTAAADKSGTWTMQVAVSPGLIVCSAVGKATSSSIYLQFSDNQLDENWMPQKLHWDTCVGTAQRPFFFPTRRSILRDSFIHIDYTEASGVDNIIFLVLPCIWPYDPRDLTRFGKGR